MATRTINLDDSVFQGGANCGCGPFTVFLFNPTLLAEEGVRVDLELAEEQTTEVGKATFEYDDSILADPSKPLRSCDIKCGVCGCIIEYFNSIEDRIPALSGRIRRDFEFESEEIADGASMSGYSFVFPEAAIGDTVLITTNSDDADGMFLSGYVTTNGNVEVSVFNLSGAAKDLEATEIYIDIFKGN
jgi:hypothetical protein